MEPTLYAIRPIPGRGQGLVAISKIPKGARILSETPLFTVPRDNPNVQFLNEHIIEQLKALTRDDQRAFFSLHNAHQSDHRPFLGIAKTNVLPLGSQARQGGLFLVASRVNHSCRSNAQNTWNEKIGRITVHALRDIEQGQEITISYLGRYMKYTERQEFLKEKFHFDCMCDLCILLPSQREESDLRLSSIQGLDNMFDGFGSFGDTQSGLSLVRARLRVLAEEGIWDASIPRAYYDAFQLAIANGDKERAKVFAERAHAARIIVEGEDSPSTARMKQFAERPTLHSAYNSCSGGLMLRARPPQDVDGGVFDDWLWMEEEGSERSFDSMSSDSIGSALFRSLRRGN